MFTSLLADILISLSALMFKSTEVLIEILSSAKISILPFEDISIQALPLALPI